MKKCNKCLKIKQFNDFVKNKLQKDGYHYVCKNCRKEYNQKNQDNIKDYREKNKHKLYPQIQEWKLNNPERIKGLWKINNAKKTKEDIKLGNQKQNRRGPHGKPQHCK